MSSHVKWSSWFPLYGSIAHIGVASCFFLPLSLATAPVVAQSFAPPLVPEPSPQGGRYCIDYNVINNTHGEVTILFQDSNEEYHLEPGQSVAHHNKSCFQFPIVSASYSGPIGTRNIGRNLPLDLLKRSKPPTPNWEFVESGSYVFLKAVGESVPPEFH